MHVQSCGGVQNVILNITNRCNFKCLTCLRGPQTKEEISFQVLANFLRQCKDLGIPNVVLTGGEPILHSDFCRIITQIAELGLKFGFVSNGWLYEDYSKAIAPVREHVHFAAISLDGHTASLHDSNRRAGSFDRALLAIKHFIAQGYPVRVGHIINRVNADYLLPFMRLMREFDVTVNIGCVISNDTNDVMQLDEQQLRKVRRQIRAVVAAYKQKVKTTVSLGMNHELLFCPRLTKVDNVTLQFDGKVVFCCDILRQSRSAILGDITKEPLSEILPRCGRVVGQIMEARIRALISGQPPRSNDCDFCNHVLSQEI